MRVREFTCSALLVAFAPASAGMEVRFITLQQSDQETAFVKQRVLAGDPRPETDHLEVKTDSSSIDHSRPSVVEQVQKLMQQSTVPDESLQELAQQTMEAFAQGPKIIIRSSDIPVDLRGVEYKGLLGEFVDFDSMGKLVLGENQGQMSPAQFNEFVKLYKEFLLSREVFGSIDNWDSAVEIVGLTPVGMKGFMVTFDLDSSKLGKARLSFYIHKSDSGFPFKFVDVIVQGISLIKTQRADFAAIIKTQGLEGLNQTLARRMQDHGAP